MSYNTKENRCQTKIAVTQKMFVCYNIKKKHYITKMLNLYCDII